MFTIIICTYNGGNRIERVVNCIVNQTMFDSLVQKVLIVDNCSTDSTSEVIKELTEENSKIIYLYEPEPGLSNARLCGIKNVDTTWIVFLDDDNFIDQNWLCGVAEYIKTHDGAGAFNGRVIPRFKEALTDEQYVLLKAAYCGLACTCYSETQDISIGEYKRMPFGAGLVILREPLENLARNGWLASQGRKQDKIISGEDTEMVEWVKESGFRCGFCETVSLYHEINIRRLELGYLRKLYMSFGESYYRIISKKKFYILRRMKWGMIEGFHFVRAFILNLKQKRKKTEDFYRNELRRARAKGYLLALMKEFIFLSKLRRKTNRSAL